MIRPVLVPLTDDDLYEKQEKTFERTEQFVLFRLDSEWYGIKTDCVQEVTQTLFITPFPSLPDSIIGMTHLRGNILSVTDLKRIFKLPETTRTKKNRLLIVAAQARETALLVDEVSEIITIPTSILEAPLITLGSEQAGFIEYNCSWNERLIAILKTEKLWASFPEVNAA